MSNDDQSNRATAPSSATAVAGSTLASPARAWADSHGGATSGPDYQCPPSVVASGIDQSTSASGEHADAGCLSAQSATDSSIPAVREVSGVIPSGSCECSPSAGQLVFALGKLGIDYGTEARRDSVAQHMQVHTPDGTPNPENLEAFLAYASEHAWEAESVIWTLNLNNTAVYAIQPVGPHAHSVYEHLTEMLSEQVVDGIERVSIAGRLFGEATLLNGQRIPSIAPVRRGMYSWNTPGLIEAVLGKAPAQKDTEAYSEFVERQTRLESFLQRIYHEFQNLGILPTDRAINFAAANAMNVAEVFKSAFNDGLEFDEFKISASPICRPGSECYEILLYFFNPEHVIQHVRRVFRFTVDVSDDVPVTIGPVRGWNAR